MKMAKLILTLACIGLTFTGCGHKESKTRIENGFLISTFYHETGDYVTSTIATSEGNIWEVDDYVCNIGAELQVTFDTMGTDDITDDQIVKIVATVEK